MSVIQPIIFATIAYYMFRSGGRSGTLLYASLGAGMMGVWSSTLFGSGGMIQWQRWQGTLELGAAAPPSLAVIYLPFSLATSFTGMYALAATLVWGRLLFGVPLTSASVALCPPLLNRRCAGLMGLVLASTFILYRFANALEPPRVPCLIACGLTLDLAAPGWTRLISCCRPTGVCSRSGMPRRRQRVAAADGRAGLVCLATALTFRLSDTSHVPGDAVAHMSAGSVFLGTRLPRPLQLDPPGDLRADDARRPFFQLILFYQLGSSRMPRTATSTSS